MRAVYRILAVMSGALHLRASYVLALSSVLCIPTSLTQIAAAQSAGTAAHSVRRDAAEQQLQRLLDQQQAAIRTGDGEAIVAATKRVTAAALQGIAGLRLLERRNPEALDLYRQAIPLDDTAASHVDLAVALFRSGQNAAATTEVDRALAADTSNARAWQLKGSLQMAGGNFRDAVAPLAHSLDLQPDVNAQYALGFSLLKSHEKEKAAKVFQNMLALYGDKAIWHVIFGGAYRDAEYPDDAIAEFKKAIAMDPKVKHGSFFLGLTYLQENHWGPNAESLASFHQAIRLEPRDYLVNFYLGAIESTQKQFAQSDAHLHVAAELEPQSPETWLYLGLNAFQRQDFTAAKQFLQRSVETTGADEARNNYQIRRAYFVLGRIAASQGDQPEASRMMARVREFQQKTLGNSAETINATMQKEGLGTAPGVVPALPSSASHDSVEGAAESGSHEAESAAASPPAVSETELREIAAREAQLRKIASSGFNDLGTAAARQHQYDEALTAFREAERWDATTPGLERNLGLAAFRQEDFTDSARALEKVLAENPSDERSRMMLAMSLFSLDKYKEATGQFALLPHTSLTDARAAYAYAYSLAHSGKPQQANQIADQLASQPLPAEVLSLVCHLYMDVENYEHSASCYRNAYQQYPTLKRAHYEVGASLIHLDRPQEAVPELQQELTLSPNDPDVEYYLAYALLQTSHKPEAAKILESVVAAQPGHAEAQYQLGKLLLEDGKTDEAIQHLEIAENKDPAVDYIHYQLQIAYRKAGRAADAEREVKTYREIKARHREITPHP